MCALLQASAGPPRAGVLLGPGPHSSVNIIRYPNLINDHFNFQIQSQQCYKSIKTTISIKKLKTIKRTIVDTFILYVTTLSPKPNIK